MSQPPNNDRGVEAVLLDALDRAAADADLAWLNDRLRNDPEARQVACQFLIDESLLAEDAKASLSIGDLSRLASKLTPTLEDTPPPHWRGGFLGFVDRHGLAVAAVAATLLVALAVQNVVTLQKLERLHALAIFDQDSEANSSVQRREVARANRVEGESVGRVTGLDSVEWEEGQSELAFGDSISEGSSLHVARGVVELLLATGAKVTIQGPAHFEASTPLESSLNHGKIAAAVPRSARGYTILTPTSEVVDLGTQFGVAVEQTGDTELHVFDGDVVARSRLKDASPDLIHAQRNEAVRFDSMSDQPTRFEARKLDFVRRIGPVFAPEQLPQLPVTESLSLWYSADMIPDTADGDSVATWRDLLVGDNDFADDAWQFDSRRCPQMIVDDAGRKALRFDGWSTFLATSPMETADRQTMFVVYAPGPTSFANDYHGGILLKYPTAPSLELSVFDDRSTRGWLWPGDNGKQNVGVVRSGPVEQLGVSVVAYQYDSQSGVAELWNNGVSQGRSEAPLAIRQVGRRYLGSHPNAAIEAGFFGNVYEVLTYDASLAPADHDRIFNYFQKRYGIEPSG